MAAAPQPDEWEAICAFVRAYAMRKYGQPAVALTIHLYHGDAHREPIPLAAVPQRSPRAPNYGNAPRRILSDCQRVFWPGMGELRFAPKQAVVVRELWRARFELEEPDVPQADLLRAAESEGTRLRDLFTRHPAWGTVIVQGESPGTYRLVGPPEDDITIHAPEED